MPVFFNLRAVDYHSHCTAVCRLIAQVFLCPILRGMSYTRIGKEDWPVIARMLRAEYAGAEIARTLGKDPSAVNRHVKTHGGRDGYDIREVRRRKHMERVDAMRSIRALRGSLLRSVVRLLKIHLSPEQIAGVMRLKGETLVASTIYRYLDERAPHLKKYLRSSKGKYRRRYGTKAREDAREAAKKRRID